MTKTLDQTIGDSHRIELTIGKETTDTKIMETKVIVEMEAEICHVVALEAVDYPTFLVLGVLVLWFHEDLFYCGVYFEVSLYAIHITCVF